MFSKVTSLSIFFLMAFGSLCHGQLVQKYTVTNYTDENGLPQNSVKGIAADKDGFIWLSTENGLVRFDGHHFYTFTKSNSSISSSRFDLIFPEMSNSVNQSIYARNESLEMMKISSGVAVKDSLYKDKFWRIFEKNLIDSTKIGADGSISWKQPPNVKHFILPVPGRPGVFYMAESKRLNLFVNWEKVWSRAFKGKGFDGIALLRGEFYRFEDDGSIKKFTQYGDVDIFLTGDLLKDPAYLKKRRNFTMYRSYASDQVFILLNSNFYVVEAGNGNVLTTRLLFQGFDIQAENIQCVYFNSLQNRLFIGTLTNGLYVLQANKFVAFRINEIDRDNVFYAQTVLNSSQILTAKGTVIQPASSSTGWNTNLTRIVSNKIMSEPSDGYAVLTDQNNNIWTKHFNKLYQYDGSRRNLIYQANLNDPISTIYEGRDGRIWIGTGSRGLFFLEKAIAGQTPKVFPGPTIKDITYILQSSVDVLWLGTRYGLYLVNLKTGTTVLIKGTERLFVRSLFVSDAGKSDTGVFFTTYDDGIFYYRANNLVQIPMQNSYLATAHCLVEDKLGFVWVPTNRGLFQFAKKDLLDYTDLVFQKKLKNQNLYYLYYDKASGFNTNEFNGGCQPCAVRLPDGKISLPSLDGLVLFNPSRILPEVTDKKLFIDRVEVRGKPSMVSGDTIQLSMDPRQVNFHVATPYFGHNSNLRLSYAISSSGKLPGVNEWLDVDNADPLIRFPELAPGSYTLLIRKMDGFGIDNFDTTRLVIMVPAHWYESWLLKLLGIALLGGLIYMYVQIRTQNLNRRNEELEVRIKSRTQNLEETMTALKNSESVLSRQMHIQNRMVASISHDIRTPMKYLVEGSAKIESLINTRDYAEAAEKAHHMGASAQMMNNLLDNIINYIRTQYNGDHVGFQEVNLNQLLNDKIRLFYPAITEQENRFSNEIGNDVSVFSNDQLLGILLHNMLDNANKYTYKGRVRLFTERHQDQLYLIIKDTGPGFPVSILKWLNTTSTATLGEEKRLSQTPVNSGLGLLIVKEIAELLHIDLIIENLDGAKITLIFTIE